MALYSENAIPCHKCWKAAENRCCHNLRSFLVVHELEVYDFGFHFLEPFTIKNKTFPGFYQLKSKYKAKCPHLIDGRCNTHKDRPNDCYMYPILVGTKYIHFDLWCPGVCELIPEFKLGNKEFALHVKRSIELARKYPGYQKIIDLHMNQPGKTECKMSITEAKKYINAALKS